MIPSTPIVLATPGVAVFLVTPDSKIDFAYQLLNILLPINTRFLAVARRDIASSSMYSSGAPLWVAACYSYHGPLRRLRGLCGPEPAEKPNNHLLRHY